LSDSSHSTDEKECVANSSEGCLITGTESLERMTFKSEKPDSLSVLHFLIIAFEQAVNRLTFFICKMHGYQ
jgi:hypothetical protein